MIDGVVVGKGAVETLSLMHTLVKMIQSAEAEGKQVGINQLIADLPPQALKLADQFLAELKELRARFIDAFKDNPKELDRCLPELQSETWWWRWKRYKLLRDFAPTVDAITTGVDVMISDFVAVAHCKEKDALLAQATSKARLIRQSLSKRADIMTVNVRDVLNNLVDAAQAVRNELDDMVHGRT